MLRSNPRKFNKQAKLVVITSLPHSKERTFLHQDLQDGGAWTFIFALGVNHLWRERLYPHRLQNSLLPMAHILSLRNSYSISPFSLVRKRGGRRTRIVSKSKIACADSSSKVTDFALYGHRSAARKRVSCVLSTANVIILFRIIEIFNKNLFAFLEITKEEAKTWGHCDESLTYFVTPSPSRWKLG